MSAAFNNVVIMESPVIEIFINNIMYCLKRRRSVQMGKECSVVKLFPKTNWHVRISCNKILIKIYMCYVSWVGVSNKLSNMNKITSK